SISVAKAASSLLQTHSQRQVILNTTAAWVRRWVIGQKLCPFARPLVDRGVLRLRLVPDLPSLLPVFHQEVLLLLEQHQPAWGRVMDLKHCVLGLPLKKRSGTRLAHKCKTRWIEVNKVPARRGGSRSRRRNAPLARTPRPKRL
ncbi:unnamed protein product, partial [Amoebophrya sp. A120]